MNTLKSWLATGVAITALSGMVYLTVQQNYRSSANDPQIQVAEDLAAQLATGQNQFNLPTAKSEMTKSLAPVIMIIDDTGKSLYSSGVLDGAPVLLPKGVLDYAKANGEDRVTWQPKASVRMALVVTIFTSKTTNKVGYVAVAKSLRETEKRIDRLTWQVGAAWFAALITSFLAQWLFGRNRNKSQVVTS